MDSSGQRVLLIDPDNQSGHSLKRKFLNSSWEVEQVPNIFQAISIINSVSSLELVLYSFEIGEENIPLLIKEVKQRHIHAEVILISKTQVKFSLLSAQERKNLDISLPIEKIYDLDKFFKNILSEYQRRIVEHDRSRPTENVVEGNARFFEENFVQIDPQTTLELETAPYNLYIQINTGKYLKIFNASDLIPVEQVKRYIDKGLHHFYVKKTDRVVFATVAGEVHLRILKMKKKGFELKQMAIMKTNLELISCIKAVGFNKELLDLGITLANGLTQHVRENKYFKKFFKEILAVNASFESHGYMVAVIAVMILQKFDWRTQSLSHEIVLAAILHDIGKVILPAQSILLRPDEMGPTK